MSFWNPTSDLGDMMGQVQNSIENLGQYKTQGLNVNDLDTRANQTYNNLSQMGNQNLMAALMRGMGQAGNAATAQGYAQNLSNPYAYKNLMQGQAFDKFAPMFGDFNLGIAQQKGNAMMQNPLTAFNTQYQSNQGQLQALMNLLGMKSGLAQQRAQSEFNFGDIMPGLLSAGGSLGSAMIQSNGMQNAARIAKG